MTLFLPVAYVYDSKATIKITVLDVVLRFIKHSFNIFLQAKNARQTTSPCMLTVFSEADFNRW